MKILYAVLVFTIFVACPAHSSNVRHGRVVSTTASHSGDPGLNLGPDTAYPD
jgi:hypothetical protein